MVKKCIKCQIIPFYFPIKDFFTPLHCCFLGYKFTICSIKLSP